MRYKKLIIAVAFILGSALQATAQPDIASPAAETDAAPIDVEINLEPARPAFVLGSPLECIYTITNKSAVDIAFLFPRRTIDRVGIYGPGTDDWRERPENQIMDERTPIENSKGLAATPPVPRQPTVLKPGGVYRRVVYLNRQVVPLRPGSFTLKYLTGINGQSLDAAIAKENAQWGTCATGTLDLKILPPDHAATKLALQQIAKQLASTDEWQRLEAQEALLFIDIPEAVPHLKAFLDQPYKIRRDAIRALVRIGTPESLRPLVAPAADSRSKSHSLVFHELQRHGVVLPTVDLRRLLISRDSWVRSDTVKYLAAAASARDIARIEILTNDRNPLVVAAMHDVIARRKQSTAATKTG